MKTKQVIAEVMTELIFPTFRAWRRAGNLNSGFVSGVSCGACPPDLVKCFIEPDVFRRGGIRNDKRRLWHRVDRHPKALHYPLYQQ